MTSFDAAAAVVARVQESATHPSELYVADRRVTHVGDDLAVDAARMGALRRPHHRRDRRDRRVDHAARRLRRDEAVSRAAQRPRRPAHAVRRVLLRRVPDAGRGRLRRRARATHAAAAAVTPDGARRSRARTTRPHPARAGAASTSTTSSRSSTPRSTASTSATATASGMLGGSYGGFMATWLAGHHGERFRAFCSERAVNNATVSGVVVRHLDVLRLGPRRRSPRRTRRVRADVADRVRAAASTSRC